MTHPESCVTTFLPRFVVHLSGGWQPGSPGTTSQAHSAASRETLGKYFPSVSADFPRLLEAPTGIEPVYTALQAAA
jgi:hypothetical protein